MQAINALWKKVSTMQSTSNTSTADLMQTSQSFAGIENNSTAVVQDLAKTCSVLTNQVGFADFMRFSYITNHQFDCRCNNCRAPCATFSNAWRCFVKCHRNRWPIVAAAPPRVLRSKTAQALKRKLLPYTRHKWRVCHSRLSTKSRDHRRCHWWNRMRLRLAKFRPTMWAATKINRPKTIRKIRWTRN